MRSSIGCTFRRLIEHLDSDACLGPPLGAADEFSVTLTAFILRFASSPVVQFISICSFPFFHTCPKSNAPILASVSNRTGQLIRVKGWTKFTEFGDLDACRYIPQIPSECDGLVYAKSMLVRKSGTR